MTEAFPLHWPPGRPRTPAHQRKSSRFDQSHEAAINFTRTEIARLGGEMVVLSTDVELRRDGLPYANQRVSETGVAVYFLMSGKQMSFACDRWDRLADNVYAIGKTIEALRGIARWGTGDMQQAAFSGFAALPPPAATEPVRPWWEVLQVGRHAPLTVIEAAFRALAKVTHPDVPGGSDKAMQELNRAWVDAKSEVG